MMSSQQQIWLLALVCLLNSVQVAPATAKKGWKVKGMAFSTGHDLYNIRQPLAQKSLDLLKTTHVNYIHVSAYGQMKDKLSLKYTMETDDDSIRYQIRMHKLNGLKVFFKPVLELDGDVWRGFIPGRNSFIYNVYGPFILHMAKIAEEEKVDMFSVGSEYRDTLRNVAAWRWIIARTRAVYTGTLTYVANHDSYQSCKFWDAVDVISISAYFILVHNEDGGMYGWSPNMKLTEQLWEEKALEVEQWWNENKLWGKKILVAEVGAQSKGGGVVYRRPFLWTSKASVDDWEQAKMYSGILNAFMPKHWCLGIILWNWELHHDANLWQPGKSGYTPQNKPAMKIMKWHFARW